MIKPIKPRKPRKPRKKAPKPAPKAKVMANFSVAMLPRIKELRKQNPRNSLENIVLLIELENYLTGKGYQWEAEKPVRELYESEHNFRYDYYVPELKAAIEINGGQYVGGRHNRGGEPYEKDLKKLNISQKNNIFVFQFTYEMLSRAEYMSIC